MYITAESRREMYSLWLSTTSKPRVGHLDAVRIKPVAADEIFVKKIPHDIYKPINGMILVCNLVLKT